MRRPLPATLILAALLTSVAGCPTAGAPGGGGRNVVQTLTTADDGAAVELAPGEEVLVTVSAHVALGLEWFITQLDREVVEFRQREDVLLGAGNTDIEPITQRWFFRAVRPGSTTLQMLYLQNQNATMPVDSFTLSITVRASESP